VAREKQNIMYEGNLLRVSADFSAETLQTRIEWYDIFKVLKGKNPIIQEDYHSFLKEREFPRQTDIKGVYHNQTGLTRNVKGTSSRGKEMTIEVGKL